jgi:hypothetical protein
MTTTIDSTTDLDADIGAFAERIFLATVGAFELAAVELGMRLGLYATLAESPSTPPQLAAAAGVDVLLAACVDG